MYSFLKVCSNYYDAFSLMIDNKISLHYLDTKGDAKKWIASAPILITDKKITALAASHSNPCRAIAECYLLMRDVHEKI